MQSRIDSFASFACQTADNGLLPEVFDNTFQYARNIHRYNTRYSAKQNFYKNKIKTNAGKQSLSYMAMERPSIFFERLKYVCISEVYKTLPPVGTKTEPIFHLAKSVY